MTDSSDPENAQVERYRELRRQIEEAILPLATSVDGRHFTCQVSAHDLQLQVGGYVMIEHDGKTRLGQLLDLELEFVDGPEVDLAAEQMDAQVATTVKLRVVRGSGVVRDGDPTPFHDGLVRPASSVEVHAWLERVRPARAELEVGELRLAPGAPFRLNARGFDRHTFLCGRSGCGKTYSLGVMLEQLLLATSLRIVVLDPNSDFVRLGETHADVDEAVVRRHAASAGVVVRRAVGSRPPYDNAGAGSVTSNNGFVRVGARLPETHENQIRVEDDDAKTRLEQELLEHHAERVRLPGPDCPAGNGGDRIPLRSGETAHRVRAELADLELGASGTNAYEPRVNLDGAGRTYETVMERCRSRRERHRIRGRPAA